MSRIADPARSAIADICARVRRIAGSRVPNTYATLGHLAPMPLATVLNAGRSLLSGSFNRRERQTIPLLVRSKTSCDVYVDAHGFGGTKVGLPADALRATRAGKTTGVGKRGALVRGAPHSHTTTGTISADEFTAVPAGGHTDTRIAKISLAIRRAIFTNPVNRTKDIGAEFSGQRGNHLTGRAQRFASKSLPAGRCGYTAKLQKDRHDS